MGASPKTSTEGPFCFWNDPGRRPHDSDSPAARSSVRAALVFEIYPLSRNVALSGSGQAFAERKAAGSHRGIQSARAPVLQLPSRATLGGTKSRAFSALDLAPLSRRRRRGSLRRRGSRCYVLLD